METPHEPQQPTQWTAEPQQAPIQQPQQLQQPLAPQPQAQPGAPVGAPGAPASAVGNLAASPLTLWPLLAAVASLLLLIGGAGPWASALGDEVGGASGDGAIVIVLSLLALAAAVVMVVPALAHLAWRRHLGWVIAGVGLISIIVGLYDTSRIHQFINDNEAQGYIHLGWGLVMTDIFAFVVTALGVLAALTARHAQGTAHMAAGGAVPMGQNPQVMAARGTLAGLANRAAQRLDPQAQQAPQGQQGTQPVQPEAPQGAQPVQQPKPARQWTMPEQH